jgi:hypothetical protein
MSGNMSTNQKIDISMDQVWAGSGIVREGRIENCSAQFCIVNDISLSLYEDIESAIANGKTSIKVEVDGEAKTIAWRIS